MSILQVTNFLYLFVLGLSTFFNRPTTLYGTFTFLCVIFPDLMINLAMHQMCLMVDFQAPYLRERNNVVPKSRTKEQASPFRSYTASIPIERQRDQAGTSESYRGLFTLHGTGSVSSQYDYR